MSITLNSAAPSYCPLCQGVMRHLFDTNDYRKPYLTEQYEVVWCARCAYGKITADLSPDRVATFYEVEYYTHGASISSEPRRSLLEQIRTHLAWRFDKGSDFSPQEIGAPGRIIDIGCGGGNNMEKLKAAGFSVVGIEPDPKARIIAAQFGPVYSGTAEALPQEVSEKFDYALLSHVLEHTISPSDALERVHGLLSEGGRLIVEVPNCEATGFDEFGPNWPWTDVPRHIHFFTQQSLTKFLEAAGFSVSRVLFTGFTRQFDSSWISTLNAIHDELCSAEYSRSWLTRQSWGLLFRTALASPNNKYDSIRMHALRV
jgi:SAM-dependent methyltransferase